jgi:cell division protein FtsQ
MSEEPNKSSIGERMKSSKQARKPIVFPIQEVRKPEPEPEPPKKETRKRAKAAFCVLLALIMIAGAFIAGYFLTTVKTITVSGCERYSESEVADLSGLYTGRCIFLYDLAAAKKKIESDPYLKCVSISRKLPYEISIKVEERKEFGAVATSSDNYCIIDREGYVLDVGRRENIEGLIPIYGLGSMGLTLGSKIDSDRGKLRPYVVMEILDSVGDRIGEIASIDISNTSSVKLTTKSGLTVMLGDSIDIPAKIERMFSAMKKVDPNKTAGATLYINSVGTTDISYSSPVPTNAPEKTQEPLPTNVPEETPEPTETDVPAETGEPDGD